MFDATVAGLSELLRWEKQWHNEPNPAYGIGMGISS